MQRSLVRYSAQLFNTSRLQNKTVLVTGASSGIGAATSLLFAKAGANVILAARRLPELEAVKKACLEVNSTGKFTTVQVDMSSRSSITSSITPHLSTVSILVNNAGLVKGLDKIGDIMDEDIDIMLNTNVVGLIHLTQLVVKEFKARNDGHVINIGSIAGREPYAGGAIYCASKHAVRSFTTSLLKELVDTDIRVSEIQPGMVETSFSLVRFRGEESQAKKVYEGVVPLTGEDIAEEIVWVAMRPKHVNVAEVLVFPVQQAAAGIVHRK